VKSKLKLFVFTEFNPDHTSGLAFAIAKDETDARKLIEMQGFVADWGYEHSHPLNRRVAYCVSGGG
jgi:hypothetical protein